MKKVVAKNGKKETYFETYVIGESNVCPSCHRPFKEHDIKALEERGQISCLKCGNKLKRK